MLTAKYLTNKWVKPLQDKFREQGREQGLAEGIDLGRKTERKAWLDRERRRI